MKNGPKYKICRRLGAGVFEKCQTQKFVVSESNRSRSKNSKKPKQHSEYGLQLIEKQKIRFSYGISEKQLSNYVKEATTTKGVVAADRLYENLERRLDNVVYRLALGHTRALARQMVAHGHITVNGKKITAPSYQVKTGDMIAVREGSRKSVMFAEMVAKLKTYTIPNWLSFSPEKLEAVVKAYPKNTETFLNFNTVLEFYSR